MQGNYNTISYCNFRIIMNKYTNWKTNIRGMQHPQIWLSLCRLIYLRDSLRRNKSREIRVLTNHRCINAEFILHGWKISRYEINYNYMYWLNASRYRSIRNRSTYLRCLVNDRTRRMIAFDWYFLVLVAITQRRIKRRGSVLLTISISFVVITHTERLTSLPVRSSLAARMTITKRPLV